MTSPPYLSIFISGRHDTIEFLEPKIDLDGNLVVNLRNIRISPKAHSQCRKSRDLPQRTRP